MRSEILLAIAVSAAAAGCAAQAASGPQVCKPVSSWAAPAYRCEPAAAAPAPEPEPAMAEPEPPPPRAEVTDDDIELKETVQFETDSAILLDASKPMLNEVAQILKDHPEIAKVQVQGHTDSKASPGHNLKLSNDRAAAVRKYLVEQGVEADRLASKGFGETKPIADNKTEEGRATNRRVELKILQRK